MVQNDPQLLLPGEYGLNLSEQKWLNPILSIRVSCRLLALLRKLNNKVSLMRYPSSIKSHRKLVGINKILIGLLLLQSIIRIGPIVFVEHIKPVVSMVYCPFIEVCVD